MPGIEEDAMEHAEALERVRASGLQGPAHGNLNRVREIMEGEPGLVEALNAVDAGKVDETPQGAAAHTHSRRILQYMIEKGVREDIFMAAALGDAKRVGEMLRENRALTTARGAHGIPLIAHAADKATGEAMIAGGVECDIFIAA